MKQSYQKPETRLIVVQMEYSLLIAASQEDPQEADYQEWD